MDWYTQEEGPFSKKDVNEIRLLSSINPDNSIEVSKNKNGEWIVVAINPKRTYDAR